MTGDAEAIRAVLDYCAGNANDEAMALAAADADGQLDRLLARLEAVTQERDERMKRESGLALIEDAKRWERAYMKARDELAVSEARLQAAEEALRKIADNAEAWHGPTPIGPGHYGHPAALGVIAKTARAALAAAAPGEETT